MQLRDDTLLISKSKYIHVQFLWVTIEILRYFPIS